MITYLQLHPNMRLLVAFALLFGLVAVIAVAWHRLVARRPDFGDDIDWRTDPADLPGQPRSMPAPLAGEYQSDDPNYYRAMRLIGQPRLVGADEWEQLDADQAADILIAEWHDEPPADWPAAPDVWDAWWAGMDGLERECLKVTRLRQREQQLWAELKAETRELCAA